MEANASNLFTNPRSWYPANTTCTYLFTSPKQTDRISLHFVWFRIDRVTLCHESLRIYDSRDPDPDRLMNRLCDTNKPLVSFTPPNFMKLPSSLSLSLFSVSDRFNNRVVHPLRRTFQQDHRYWSNFHLRSAPFPALLSIMVWMCGVSSDQTQADWSIHLLMHLVPHVIGSLAATTRTVVASVVLILCNLSLCTFAFTHRKTGQTTKFSSKSHPLSFHLVISCSQFVSLSFDKNKLSVKWFCRIRIRRLPPDVRPQTYRQRHTVRAVSCPSELSDEWGSRRGGDRETDGQTTVFVQIHEPFRQMIRPD